MKSELIKVVLLLSVIGLLFMCAWAVVSLVDYLHTTSVEQDLVEVDEEIFLERDMQMLDKWAMELKDNNHTHEKSKPGETRQEVVKVNHDVAPEGVTHIEKIMWHLSQAVDELFDGMGINLHTPSPLRAIGPAQGAPE